MNENVVGASREPLVECQRRLVTIWFVGGGLIFIVMILESLGNIYGSQVKGAWSWVVPVIVPTLSLMIGVLISGAMHAESQATVDRFAYRVSVGLSVFYLLLVLGSLVLWPAAHMYPLDLMTLSSSWLGPVQGLAGIAIGGFFGSRKK